MIPLNLEVSNLLTPFVNGYKALSNEYKHFFEVGLEEYLHNQTVKYLFTNTFLHRAEKVNFFNIYYPIKVQYQNNTIDFENIADTLHKYRYITIVGSAGSGKSTLTKFIFLNAIKKADKIPILIELRNLNDYGDNLEKLVINKILNTSIEPSESIAKRTLKKGGFLFLLDGYDEIYTNKKQKVNEQIDSFIDAYANNNFIITTRPGGGIEGFNRFLSFWVTGLEETEINEFVKMMVDNQERRNRIINLLAGPLNNNYIEYLSNPLLLSMFILAFESHPEIPTKKTAFYRNVFDTLYSKHDGVTKNSYLREKKTKLQRESFQQILYLFSYLSYVDGQYEFTFDYFSHLMIDVKKMFNFSNVDNEDLLYDFETTISIFIKDGFEYKFPHRSMQEYFAAEFVSKLPNNKKGIAYRKLLRFTSGTSTDESLNVWHLSNELDESSLIESFIIPELLTILNKLNKQKSLDLIKNFFLMFPPSIFMAKRKNRKTKDIKESVRLYRNTSFENNLLNFCDAHNFKEYFNFFQLYSCNDQFVNHLKMIGVWGKREWYEDLAEDEVGIKLLIKNKFLDIIRNLKLLIQEKIIFYEKKIKDETSIIDELLDL